MARHLQKYGTDVACKAGKMEETVAMSKYLGLCETCDHDAVCTLKRSPKLEIIQCEEYSTQPVMCRQQSAPKEMSSSAAPESGGPAGCDAGGLCEKPA